MRSAGLRLIRFRSLAKIHFPSEGPFSNWANIGEEGARREAQVSSKALFTSPMPCLDSMNDIGGVGGDEKGPSTSFSTAIFPRGGFLAEVSRDEGGGGVTILGASIYLQFKSLVILVTSWLARKLGNEYCKSTVFPGR